MKKKEFELITTTDMKVFLLFLLDNIGYPLEHNTLISIVQENTDEISLDYDECLRQLVVSEHLLYDEVGEERYYMISDKGRLVASELYDSLDKNFRERSLRIAIKHISLSKSGAGINAYITETESKRFKVTLEAFDKYGDLMRTSITVNSMAEAVEIKNNYDTRPDGVYKGILFSVTGKMDFLA
jgi:hypothetical protein